MPDWIEGSLQYQQLGKYGAPMAFVHPNPMDNSCWLYQMARFSTWFKTIGIDLPGYGRSPAARPGITMPQIAQSCWDAVDEVSDEDTILFGLSVGVSVVLNMAGLRPDRTRAVILSGTGYSPVREYPRQRIAYYQERGIAGRFQHVLEDYSPRFREGPLANYFAALFTERNAWADIPTIIEMFKALEKPEPDSLLQGLKMPVLIVTGSLDSAHPRAAALQAHIPGCELATIEDAGHACNMEKPWEFDEYVLSFLRRHDLLGTS